MTLLCTAPHCALPREHTQGCDGDQCRGCLPAPAIPGEAFCEVDSAKLRRWLAEIPELFADVVDPPSATDTREAHEKVTTAALDVGEPVGRPRDPIAALLPAGAVPGASRQPRVSGSGDEAVAVRYVEAGPGSTRVSGEYAEDQIGEPPPAVVLDSWARDWQGIRRLGELLPPPTVAHLCWWLENRLPWALAKHDAMAEFYNEIRTMHARLWSEAGRSEPKPEHCKAVPCKRCDRMTLYRAVDGSGDVECLTAHCRMVYRREEYDDHAKMITAPGYRPWLKARAERERAST